MLNNDPLNLILSQLENVKRTSSGYTAQCPCAAHADQRNSLSIAQGRDGQVLLHCHARCSADDVMSALGVTWRELYPQRMLPVPARDNDTIYNYTDAQGTLLYQVVRKQPKGFAQRRPDKAGGGFIWNLQGVTPVLYRLPELIAAPVDRTVYVTEGEKDSERLAALGLLATTNSGGAGKWRGDAEYNRALQGRNVVVLPDNDEAGEQHAGQVAPILRDIAATIKILSLPGLPPHGDVSDWLDSGHTLTDLLSLEASTPVMQWQESAEQTVSGPSTSGPADKTPKSQSTVLLERIDEVTDCECWHTSDSASYITVTIAGCQQTMPTKSKQTRQWLVHLYYMATRRVPSAQALQDVLGILDARALYDGPEHPVYTRVAKHGDGVVLDLANDAWQAVLITAQGWQVVDDVPVRFRRPDGMLALPTPQRGGSINQLRPYVNLASDADWAKFLAYMIATLNPDGPYPLLPLHAEQGSAKSTTARLIKLLIDPNTAPLRSAPRDERDLSIAAKNNWILAYDNLSALPGWLSDALCRISTGGGFATRELHSDDGEVRFDSMRPVMLTGIEHLTTRSDLLSRSLTVSLPAIPEHLRRSERELLAAFEADRPYILGALLSAVSMALARINTLLPPQCLPRMADAALWARAAEPALGLGDGSVLAAYADSKQIASAMAIEASPVAQTLFELVAKRNISESVIGAGPDVCWQGTATELLAALDKIASDETRKLRGWPRQANMLSNHIRRIAPELRASGIDITGERVAGSGTRLITIRQVQAWSVPSAPPAPPASLGDNNDNDAAYDNDDNNDAAYDWMLELQSDKDDHYCATRM